MFRDIMEIHLLSIFHADIFKSAPCSSANTQTHGHTDTRTHRHTENHLPYSILHMREKCKTKGEKAKDKEGKTLVLLQRALPLKNKLCYRNYKKMPFWVFRLW